MTTTKTSYSVLSLDEAAAAAAERGFGLDPAPGPEAGRRGRVSVRRDLEIGSFGVNAFYQAKSGAPLVGEHDEVGPGASGHEELYVIVQGGLHVHRGRRGGRCAGGHRDLRAATRLQSARHRRPKTARSCSWSAAVPGRRSGPGPARP